MKDYDRLIITAMIVCLFAGWAFVEAITWIFSHVTIGIAK